MSAMKPRNHELKSGRIPPIREAMVLKILRTSVEDSMPETELPGYSDYVQEVRYRLIPGIW